jgi:hypothetical protein
MCSIRLALVEQSQLAQLYCATCLLPSVALGLGIPDTRIDFTVVWEQISSFLSMIFRTFCDKYLLCHRRIQKRGAHLLPEQVVCP